LNKKMVNDDSAVASLLRGFGLDGYETAAYIVLLNGSSSASNISRSSGVPQGRVYDVMNSLVEKGLVEVKPTSPKEYVALPVREGLNNRLEQLRGESDTRYYQLMTHIDDIASRLPKQVTARGGFGVRIISGEANLASKVVEMLSSAQTSIYLAGELPLQTLKCRRAVEQAAARGVEVRAMGVLDDIGREIMNGIGADVNEKEFFFHYFLTVDENELLIVTFDEKGLPYGLVSRNRDLVRAHVHQFIKFHERG
jgi:sugar-specific transcriptional regulator TrmB